MVIAKFGWGDDLIKLRLDMLALGWEPIPILGKRPRIDGWTQGEMTPYRVCEQAIVFKNHLSTGTRTGRVVAFDIDLYEDTHVEIVQQIIEKQIGRSDLRRVGRKGVALFYRKDGDPLGKTNINEGHKPVVEIFGQGAQVVCFGIHQDTRQPYRWLEPDQNPTTVPVDALLPATTEQIVRLRLDITERLIELGYAASAATIPLHNGEVKPGKIEEAKDITSMFLELVPRARQSARGWINFACPVCGHSDNRSGFQIRSDGGFFYKCFHAACEYNRATGWSPPNTFVGPRTVKLYEIMGGNPEDLSSKARMKRMFKGYGDSLKEMIKQVKESDDNV